MAFGALESAYNDFGKRVAFFLAYDYIRTYD
jgi:hypothetical protein